MVFYAPVLFSSLGMGQDSALLSSVITGAVFVAATVISILTVDTFGRKVHPFAPILLKPQHDCVCMLRHTPLTSSFDAALCRHDMRPASRQSSE